jgi:Uma2 family endonuclease
MTPTTLEAPAIVNAPPVVDDGERYEIIDGKRVEMPPVSAFASIVASRLVSKINAFAEPHDAGEAVTDTLFRLPLPRSRNRRPDGAFVSRKYYRPRKRCISRNFSRSGVPQIPLSVGRPR